MNTTATTIQDIDFGALYRQHMQAVGRPKPASVWDARADAVKQRDPSDSYTAEFVRRMDLSGCETLLDIGCGQGNIALAVAHSLHAVHGLDYSPRMLELFSANAQSRSLVNAHAILRSWDDDWSDVPACDVVVASRSTAVMDMESALVKLNDKANKRVYLSSLVGGQFGNAEPLPDYIYILNILHAMGIHARVDYIASAVPRFDAQAATAPAPRGALWAMVGWDKP